MAYLIPRLWYFDNSGIAWPCIRRRALSTWLHRVSLCLVLFIIGLFLFLASSQASQNGRNGFSSNPATNNGATCTVCHTPAGRAPIVEITGPTIVDAGTTNDYIVAVTGGLTQTAGVNLSVSGFIGNLGPIDTDLHRIGEELSHRIPKEFVGDTVNFAFRWTAPQYNTEVTLYAAGNSTNGNLDLQGDGIGTDTLGISVKNGTQPPSPPPSPAPPSDIVLQEYTSGLSAPVAIAHGGDERLFVVERAGQIRVIDGAGNLQSQPFLDIRTRVDAGASEMGLLGLAFHPDYAANGYFYVYYTRNFEAAPDRSRISRFQRSLDSNIADPTTELVMLEFEQPFSNHNAGDLRFGPDGYLYIASGDGGSGGDPQNNAQNDRVLLGKLLRIDVDDVPAAGNGPDCDISGNANYRIPPGNAFTDGAGGLGCDEIYASGLRNPWRFSFDRQTGDLWVADVGQGAFEEIDFVASGTAGGLDFGWRCYEGNHPFNTSGCSRDYFFPIHEYSHANGNCAVTGGHVYRGLRYPSLIGHYFFTDFCNTSIRTLSRPSQDIILTEVLSAGEISSPSAFAEDRYGELYVASLFDGILYKILATSEATDTDQDGVANELDNCILQSNGPDGVDAGGNVQRDTDEDGFGNMCDADINDDCIVDAADFSTCNDRILTSDPDCDLNGDGNVDEVDISTLNNRLQQPPGPSGIATCP